MSGLGPLYTILQCVGVVERIPKSFCFNESTMGAKPYLEINSKLIHHRDPSWTRAPQ